MPETTNYGLYIEGDDGVTFKSWREKMNGISDDSNMVKIDRILKEIADTGISNIEAIENSENGGDNLVVITLTTGKTVEFTVKNGTIGRDGVGIKSLIQTTTSTESGDNNIITVELTNGIKSTFTIKNGDKGNNGIPCTHSWDGTTLTVTSASGTSSADLKGDKGKSVTGISYNSSTNKWVVSFDDNGTTSSTTINGPTIPKKVTDLSDESNYYTVEEIDAMFGSYVNDVYALLIGEDGTETS